MNYYSEVVDWKFEEVKEEFGEYTNDDMLVKIMYIVNNSLSHRCGFQKKMKEFRQVVKEVGINVPLRVGKYRRKVK